MRNGATLAYYPGCSLHTYATDYDTSTRKVFEHLDVELAEIEDWSCCGALSAANQNYNFSLALPSRNLSIVEQKGFREVVAPCSACFFNLNRVNTIFRHDVRRRLVVEHALSEVGLKYNGTVEVSSALQAMCKPEMKEKIRKAVVKKLEGLKVAAYYGCLLTRPKTSFDDPQDPRSFERLIKLLGAEPVKFPMKTKCCGGVYSLIKTEIAMELSCAVLESAAANSADIIAVACPLCQLALDGWQVNINKKFGKNFNIPIVYFTHLIGIALGFDEMRYGLNNQFVSPVKALERWL